ncbi:hypothetical protein [Halocola ammonii]
MTRKLLFLFALLICIQSHAQKRNNHPDKFEVTFGETFKGTAPTTIENIFYAGEKTLLIAEKRKGKYNVIVLDKDLKEEFDYNLPLDIDRVDYSLVGLSYLESKGEMIVFLTKEGKNKGLIDLCAYSYNPAVEPQDLSVKKIATVEAEEGFLGYNEGNFSFTYSEDESKILFSYRIDIDKESNKQFFLIIDKDLNLISEKEKVSTKSERVFGKYWIRLISNEGDIYLSSFDLSNDGKHNIYYTVHKWGKDEEMKSKKIDLGTKHLAPSNYTLKSYHDYLDDESLTRKDPLMYPLKPLYGFTEDHNIVLSGLYTDERDRGAIGSFYTQFSFEDEESPKIHFAPMSTEMMTEVMRANRGLEGDDELKQYSAINNLNPLHLFVEDDGSAIVFYEYENEREVRVTKSDGGYSTKTYYYYSDVIVTKHNNDGSLAWTNRIEKIQMMVGGSSFTNVSSYPVHHDGEVSLLYSNTGNASDSRYMLYVSTIDENGELKDDEVIYDFYQDNISPMPTENEVVSSGDIILHNLKQKGFSRKRFMTRIKFK